MALAVALSGVAATRSASAQADGFDSGRGVYHAGGSVFNAGGTIATSSGSPASFRPLPRRAARPSGTPASSNPNLGVRFRRSKHAPPLTPPVASNPPRDGAFRKSRSSQNPRSTAAQNSTADQARATNQVGASTQLYGSTAQSRPVGEGRLRRLPIRRAVVPGLDSRELAPASQTVISVTADAPSGRNGVAQAGYAQGGFELPPTGPIDGAETVPEVPAPGGDFFGGQAASPSMTAPPQAGELPAPMRPQGVGGFGDLPEALRTPGGITPPVESPPADGIGPEPNFFRDLASPPGATERADPASRPTDSFGDQMRSESSEFFPDQTPLGRSGDRAEDSPSDLRDDRESDRPSLRSAPPAVEGSDPRPEPPRSVRPRGPAPNDAPASPLNGPAGSRNPFGGFDPSLMQQQGGLTCDEFRTKIAERTIDRVSLDISPPFRPDILLQSEFDRKKEAFDEQQESRLWRSIDGVPLGEGRLEDIAYEKVLIRTDRDTVEEISVHKLGEADLAYISANWGLPKECLIDQVAFTPRNWSPTTMTWKASNLCHKPLYFEQVNLERYGHTAGPVLQPVISSAHFFGSIFVLPYKMGVNRPCECQYSLGYYRPGNCAPWIIPPVPISLRGGLSQAAAMTGAFWLIP